MSDTTVHRVRTARWALLAAFAALVASTQVLWLSFAPVTTRAADALGVSERDTVLPIVPMFHVNAWGMPFSATLFGANQVYPGPYLDPKSVLELMVTERVTITAGVPTVWLGVLNELDQQPGAHDLQALRAIAIAIRAGGKVVLQGG